jgi:CheY-like chemotaxis protein
MGPAKGTILVVDDDRAIADLVEEVLRQEGYAVSRVHELGSEAVRTAVEADEPDCVLLDGGPGAGHGSSWDDAIWLGSRPRPIPVIMFTAHQEAIREAEEQASPRSQAAHFASILSKPFELEELFRQVEQAMGPATVADA